MAAASLEQNVTSDLEIGQDIVQLARLIGVNSVRRNLRTEDDAVRRDYDRSQGVPDGPKREEDDMEIVVAHGDVHVWEKQKGATPAPAPTPEQRPAPLAVSSPISVGLSSLAKTAIGAAIGLGTLGTGVSAYSMLTNRGSTVIEQPADGNAYGVGLVPPGPPTKTREEAP